MDSTRAARIAIALGRIFAALALLALLAAWVTQLTGDSLAGMTQQHLFNDAIVLALLAIIGFLDGLAHARRL